MNNCCCSDRQAASPGPPSRLMAAGPSGGLVCGILWLLCPKCPACVASYLALFGGVSLSIPATAWALAGIRSSLVAALAVGVGLLAWRFGRSLAR